MSHNCQSRFRSVNNLSGGSCHISDDLFEQETSKDEYRA